MSENASLDSLALRVTALEAENRDLRRKVEDLRRVRSAMWRRAIDNRQPTTKENA